MARSVAAKVCGVVLVLGAMCGAARAQQLDDATQAKVEAEVHRVMQESGVPSAEVGIVRGGKVVYTAAFGAARLGSDGAMNSAAAPTLAATPEMHYAIGSISKQFTAACILLLVEDGKMTLDDPVSKWFPELTRANEVKVRNLLTHTSGYEDYAPQDYTIPAWTKATRPIDVVHEWAGKPLDFDPGTKWQYSNTNFVLAGLIVEKVSGEPFWQFLEARVLRPLGLKEVLNLDTDRDRMEPRGYMRNALGPLRPATLEAPGWYFADGALSMPVRTLLEWDLSEINRSLLKPRSYDALETEMKLKDGTGTHYGLGVDVKAKDGHRVIEHAGEVGGFVAENLVYPDDKLAVAVLTNQEANPAAVMMARAIMTIVFGGATSTEAVKNPAAEAQAKEILAGLQQGKIDPGLLTENCRFYFSKETIGDFASSLGPLGAIQSVALDGESLRGGMTFRSFKVAFAGKGVRLTTYTTADGKIEQFLVEPAS
ncbi:serine hydrolase domain-containing protein [Edaphobacter bradus]|uniref:serine hydrolase domain-containing protein n=1 Tax=Edaphobacter bradus TaxID=2259016 RepID=UPI0021E09D6F|nr:serine hydrolase domain-containing protein [Edaphobacter bradus]